MKAAPCVCCRAPQSSAAALLLHSSFSRISTNSRQVNMDAARSCLSLERAQVDVAAFNSFCKDGLWHKGLCNPCRQDHGMLSGGFFVMGTRS